MIRALVLVVAGVGVAATIGMAPVVSAQQPYENCTEAAKDGAFNIPSDSPYYGPWLDRDKDGYGCDRN